MIVTGAAGTTPLSFANIPPPAAARAAPAADGAVLALDTAVARYARGSFTIREARHFSLTETLSWQQVLKPIANRVADGGGVAVPIGWQRPGYDLIALFRLADGGLFAVAMDLQSKPGRRNSIVGYYRLAGT